jgi:hypothetical protein
MKIYYESASEAIKEALKYALSKGFHPDQESYHQQITYGSTYGRVRPNVGEERRFTIYLIDSKKCLHIQLYGMKNTIELNCYIN